MEFEIKTELSYVRAKLLPHLDLAGAFDVRPPRRVEDMTRPGFDIDPDDPMGIFGWGLVRVFPWHFVGLFVTAAEAHAAREEFGAEYIVRHGVRRIRTDDFKWYREDDSD